MEEPALPVPATNADDLMLLKADLGEVEAQRRLAIVRASLVEGKAPAKIAAENYWPEDHTKILVSIILEMEALDLAQPTEDMFLRYMLRQEGCIAELDGIIDEATQEHRDADGNAYVDHQLQKNAIAAIKAKADIMERVVKTGQDLGVFTRAAKKHEVQVKGVNAASLTNRDLRELITDTVNRMSNLVTKYNLEDVVDVQAKDIPRLPAAPASERPVHRGYQKAHAAKAKRNQGIDARTEDRKKANWSPDED